jgi:hypothetical protein
VEAILRLQPLRNLGEFHLDFCAVSSGELNSFMNSSSLPVFRRLSIINNTQTIAGVEVPSQSSFGQRHSYLNLNFNLGPGKHSNELTAIFPDTYVQTHDYLR